MNEDERWARPGLEVAHVPAGEFEPVLFNLYFRCNSKPRRAGAGLALGGRDGFISGIFRFDGQRNPHRQRLTNLYRLYRFRGAASWLPFFFAPNLLLRALQQFASAGRPSGTPLISSILPRAEAPG